MMNWFWKDDLNRQMRVLYGTTNSAKLYSMRHAVEGLGLEVIGLKELGQPIPIVDESGRDPLVNAELKARAYYEAFHLPVFSCDSGLFFEEFEASEQPGTHVRRVNGRELTDEEMTAYYAGLARQHGGRLTGYYQNAICFVVDENHIFRSMDKSLSTEVFIMTDTPHPRKVKGFPMDRLSVDIKTGKYYYDLPDREVAQSTFEGTRKFFEHVLTDIDIL